jgi:hypothetical protein
MSTKATVTFRSVLQRVNRALEKSSKAIKAPRGRADRAQLGDHFMVVGDNVTETHLTTEQIEQMARDLKVLADWEEVR